MHSRSIARRTVQKEKVEKSPRRSQSVFDYEPTGARGRLRLRASEHPQWQRRTAPPGGQPGSPTTSAPATGPHASVRIGRYAARLGRHRDSRPMDDRRNSTAHASLGRGVPHYRAPPGRARGPRRNGGRSRGRARAQRDTTGFWTSYYPPSSDARG